MNRQASIAALSARTEPWDIAVIGGGATGLGIAVDAASRGYSVVLLERGDFGKGTSSRSTKLVHGGVRYLRQGNLSLVIEALRERGLLRRNAPHLVHDLEFIVPNYAWWEAPFYGIGMRLYDWLAGEQSFGPSALLPRDETLSLLPTLSPNGLRGGVLYHDGQFDDSRLLIAMARTAATHGACLLNYTSFIALDEAANTKPRGVRLRDEFTGHEQRIEARVVINATGPFTDAVRLMDDAKQAPMIAPSQGIHLVLPQRFLPGTTAIMVPRTSDGRVMFAIPWHGHTLLGTTDTPIENTPQEPLAQESEIDFLLETAAQYLTPAPSREDILSVFVGIRPLVKTKGQQNTSALSRDHHLSISPSGLITITGGKWTTYRNMAEDAVDQAAMLADLPRKPCHTRELRLHGWHDHAALFNELSVYGADAPALLQLATENPAWAQVLHPDLPIIGAQIVWAARYEMAQTLEDVLARRTRALFLNAKAAMQMAPVAVRLLAEVLGRDEAWCVSQLAEFKAVAVNYLPSVNLDPS